MSRFFLLLALRSWCQPNSCCAIESRSVCKKIPEYRFFFVLLRAFYFLGTSAQFRELPGRYSGTTRGWSPWAKNWSKGPYLDHPRVVPESRPGNSFEIEHFWIILKTEIENSIVKCKTVSKIKFLSVPSKKTTPSKKNTTYIYMFPNLKPQT